MKACKVSDQSDWKRFLDECDQVERNNRAVLDPKKKLKLPLIYAVLDEFRNLLKKEKLDISFAADGNFEIASFRQENVTTILQATENSNSVVITEAMQSVPVPAASTTTAPSSEKIAVSPTPSDVKASPGVNGKAVDVRRYDALHKNIQDFFNYIARIYRFLQQDQKQIKAEENNLRDMKDQKRQINANNVKAMKAMEEEIKKMEENIKKMVALYQRDFSAMLQLNALYPIMLDKFYSECGLLFKDVVVGRNGKRTIHKKLDLFDQKHNSLYNRECNTYLDHPLIVQSVGGVRLAQNLPALLLGVEKNKLENARAVMTCFAKMVFDDAIVAACWGGGVPAEVKAQDKNNATIKNPPKISHTAKTWRKEYNKFSAYHGDDLRSDDPVPIRSIGHPIILLQDYKSLLEMNKKAIDERYQKLGYVGNFFTPRTSTNKSLVKLMRSFFEGSSSWSSRKPSFDMKI